MDLSWFQSLLTQQQNGGSSTPSTNSPTPSLPPNNTTQPNLWSSLTASNLQSTPQPAIQQAQSQLGTFRWPQSQAYPLNIQALAGLNLSLLSTQFQQLLQDACAVSLPVGEADEELLTQALLPCEKGHESYKDALNGLHGKNGHSATLWKDYYLDHKFRLDSKISKLLKEEAVVTIKKPSVSTFKVEDSPDLPSHAPVRRRGRQLKRVKLENSSPAPPPKPPVTTGRQTLNSLTTHMPVFDKRLPAPNAEIKVPDPPSRSPTPPSRVVAGTLGNRYTAEDKDFFHKFIAWRLKYDPTLTRTELCESLAEKAPHHSATSWAAYWSNNHDIPDKILAAARGEEVVTVSRRKSSEASAEPSRSRLLKRPSYAESSSSQEEEEEEEEEEDDSSSTSEEMQVSDDDDESLHSYDESEMGKRGDPFNDADIYFAAKHIAAHPNWHRSTGRDRWEPFTNRFPYRSAKSWAEFYRRSERLVERAVRKVQEKERKTRLNEDGQSGIRSQIGRRTRATPPEASALKRKHGSEEAENDNSEQVR